MYYYLYAVESEKGYVYYERTLNTQEQAEKRIKELAARGIQSFWSNKPVHGGFY